MVESGRDIGVQRVIIVSVVYEIYEKVVGMEMRLNWQNQY